MRRIPLQYSLLWHSYLLFWIFGIFSIIWPLPALTAAGTVIYMDRRLWTAVRFIICAVIFAAAFGWASLHPHTATKTNGNIPAWANSDNKLPRLCGTVERVEGLYDNRLRITLANIHPCNANSQGALPCLCSWIWYNAASEPLPGQKLALSAIQIQPLENNNANSRDVKWRLIAPEKGAHPEISGNPHLLAKWRQTLKHNFLKALLPDDAQIDGSPDGPETRIAATHMPQAKAILPALIFGDRRYLSKSVMDDFSAATLAHSLALSGQHLCVAGLIGFLAVLGIARLRPQIYLLCPRPILVAVASVIPALLYLWIGNAPPSLMRAGCMLFVFALWLWFRFAFDGIDLLCMALLVILVINPLALMDTGLQLSALCVAIIVIAAPSLVKIRHPVSINRRSPANKLLTGLIQILAISFIIQLAMLPVSLTRFSLAGFWFPLNAIWLPLLAVAILPLCAIGVILASIWPAAATQILDIAALPCGLMIDILTSMRQSGLLTEPAFLLPHWSVFLAFGLLVVILGWLFSSKITLYTITNARAALFAILIFLAIGPVIRLYDSLSGKITMEIMDVGQAQAIGIRWPGGNLVVDGGNLSPHRDAGKTIVAPLIAANHAPRLTGVINSHPDLDHLGGLFYLLEKFNPEVVFENGEDAAGKTGDRWEQAKQKRNAVTLHAGDKIILGNSAAGASLRVLYPSGSNSPALHGNNASLVLKLSRKGQGLALLPGDVENDGQHALLLHGEDVRARIVVAPHHGSNNGFVPSLYMDAEPDFIVASCGSGNRWKFPGKKLKMWSEENHIPLLTTASNGTISAIFHANGQMDIDLARK